MALTLAISIAAPVAAYGMFAAVLHESQPPVAVAVSASNSMGIDLYRTLVQADPRGNLFISPFSIAMALAMTAEGARDDTEREMNALFHLPAAGAGGARPISAVHEGFAALERALDEARGRSDPAVRRRIDELRGALDAAHALVEQLQSDRDIDWDAVSNASREAERLASELSALLAAVERFDLRIANALWVHRSYPLAPGFVEMIDRFYGAGSATPLDMVGDPEGSRKQVNHWVEERTERRIKDLLPPGMISGLTRLIITNAVCFRGEWSTPFNEERTLTEPFRRADGSMVDVRMMIDRRRVDGAYAAFTGAGEFFETPAMVPAKAAARLPTYPGDDGFQVLQIPYKGGALAMTVLLPRSVDGLPALEAMLSAGALDEWLARLQKRPVDAAMPRFRLETTEDLSAALQRLGMRRAFTNPLDPGGAQFHGMCASSDPVQQLFLGPVLHKAWVEVTEKGTEAAAATAVLGAAASAASPQPMIPFTPQFRADRPFLFLVRDTTSGAILFMGRMIDP